MSYHDKEYGVASSTSMREFRKSGMHYLDWFENDTDQTDSTREGSAIHMAFHEPARFAELYRTIPDMALRSHDDKRAFCEMCGVAADGYEKAKAEELRECVAKSWLARGVRVLPEDSLRTIRRCAESLNLECHERARALVSGGQKEVEFHWVDRETGVKCKALIDSWDPLRGILSDLKRTVNITKGAFFREVKNRELYYQMAFYRRALIEHGESPRAAAWSVVSPERPYPWAVYEIEIPDLAYVNDVISRDLRRFADCISSGKWPSINNGEPVTVNLNLDYIS